MQTNPMMFEDMVADVRVMVLDHVLGLFEFDDRAELVKEPILLGLFCEAHLSGMEPMALVELLDESDVELLGDLVCRCLLDRLPICVQGRGFAA